MTEIISLVAALSMAISQLQALAPQNYATSTLTLYNVALNEDGLLGTINMECTRAFGIELPSCD